MIVLEKKCSLDQKIMTEAQHMAFQWFRSPDWNVFLPIKQSSSSDSTSQLCRNVHSRPQGRYEAGEEASNCHGRIYVSACKTIGNLNKHQITLRFEKGEKIQS